MEITIFYTERQGEKNWKVKPIKTAPIPPYVAIANNSPAETTDDEIREFIQKLPLNFSFNHYLSVGIGENPPPAETILIVRTCGNLKDGLTLWLIFNNKYRLTFSLIDPTLETSPFSFWRWDQSGYLRLAMPPHRLYLDIQGTTFSRKPAYK